MPCKCGSTTHKRTTHRDCPLNEHRDSSDSSDESSDEERESSRKRNFANIFPDLYEVASERQPNRKRLRKAIREQVSSLAIEGVYSFVFNISEAFTKLVEEFREYHDMEEVCIPIKDIADEIYAKALLNEKMDFAEDIADEMPLSKMDMTKSFEELIQECYDTTKTKEFVRAVENTVEHSGAFMHALREFKKYRNNENVKTFLKSYSKRLYNRHMENIEVHIKF